MTRSKGREDYILHPPSGEVLDEASATAVAALRDAQAGAIDVQIVISDGLDALSLTDEGHLGPWLEAMREHLAAAGYHLASEIVLVTQGRVRAGYRVGEILFGGLAPERKCAVLHVIGERPGNGHHTYSVYVTGAACATWAEAGTVDHNITGVVANIADTALPPATAAQDTMDILRRMTRTG